MRRGPRAGPPDDVVRIDHARHEQRWPRFTGIAAEMGLAAQLSVRIHSGDETLGALNVYSTEAPVIGATTQVVTELFATHAALALTRATNEHHLRRALRTRTAIGQATGIVMERYGLAADRAYDYLVRVSQQGNVKVRDLATAIVSEPASERRRSG